MKKHLKSIVVIFLLGVSACTAQNHLSTSKTEKKSEIEAKISPLEELLIAFITTPDALLWEKVNDIKSIEWFDKEPKEYDSKDEKIKISKSGKIMLLGFPDKKIPNDKFGYEFTYIDGNEGQSKITLNSNLEENPFKLGVPRIRMFKYYLTEDHIKLLHAQLSKAFNVKLLADQCSHEFYTYIKFYQIKFKEYEPIYAEIYLDSEEGHKYSPGSTFISFYREKPNKEMNSYVCKKINE